MIIFTRNLIVNFFLETYPDKSKSQKDRWKLSIVFWRLAKYRIYRKQKT